MSNATAVVTFVINMLLNVTLLTFPTNSGMLFRLMQLFVPSHTMSSNTTFVMSPPEPQTERSGQTAIVTPLPHSQDTFRTVRFDVGGNTGTQSSPLRTRQFSTSMS